MSGMELIDEPITEVEERRSFGSTLFTAAAAEAVVQLRPKERPCRWLQAVRNADDEVAEGAQFPLRPSEPDCAYYLRTGCCKFGSRCRFNHPREKRAVQIPAERDNGSPKQDQCKFYYMPGGCRFGETCRYSHSTGKIKAVPVELNVLGLPVRPGGRECPYYMRTGICKYSASCKFHHPEPSNLDGLHVLGYQSGSSFQSTVGFSQPETSQLVKSAPNDCYPDVSKSYVPAMSFSEWLNQFVNQSTYEDSNQFNLMKRASCHTAVNQKGFPKPVDAPFQLKETIEDNAKEYTESESENGIRGDGYKLSFGCMPYHSKVNSSELEACLLSTIGLPIRPGEPVCIYYDRFGICKFGPACKFDHPVDHDTEQSLQTSSGMIRGSKEEGNMEGNGSLVSQMV